MNLPKRKQIRLPDYDYSTPGAYFVTVCMEDRANLFWAQTSPHDAVGAAISRPLNETALPCLLTSEGALVDRALKIIPEIYPAVSLLKYVIMPNHIHLLLQIETGEDGRLIAAPTVNRVIGQMKRWVSKQAGKPIWQKSFHEHVIRNERGYLEVWNYVDTNPQKWEDDEYYAVFR